MDTPETHRAPFVAAWVTLTALVCAWLVWAYYAAFLAWLLVVFPPFSAAQTGAALTLVVVTAAQLLLLVASGRELVFRRRARTWPAYGRWLCVTAAATILPALVTLGAILFVVF